MPKKPHSRLPAIRRGRKSSWRSPRDFVRETLAEMDRDREIIRRLVVIQLWPFKTLKALSRQIGCPLHELKRVLDQYPRLHRLRKNRQLSPQDLEVIPHWKRRTSASIARLLSIPANPVVRMRRHKPHLFETVRETYPPSPELARHLQAIQAMPGWQTTSIQTIARHIGISRVRLNWLTTNRPAMAELFKQHQGPPSKWTVENIQAIHARCPSAEEAARELGVSVHRYRSSVAKLGLPRQPGLSRLRRPTFADRLEKIPDWRTATYRGLAASLKVSVGRVRELFHLHPELYAQRRPAARLPANMTEKIMSLPGWEKMDSRKMGEALGLSNRTVLSLIRVVPRLWSARSRVLNPWRDAAGDIRRVPGWETKTAPDLGRHLKRHSYDVAIAIQENPALFSAWRPAHNQHRPSRLRARIQKIPGWEKKTYREIALLVRRKEKHVRRCILLPKPSENLPEAASFARPTHPQ